MMEAKINKESSSEELQRSSIVDHSAALRKMNLNNRGGCVSLPKLAAFTN